MPLLVFVTEVPVKTLKFVWRTIRYDHSHVDIQLALTYLQETYIECYYINDVRHGCNTAVDV